MTASSSGLFAGLERHPPDALLSVIALHRADPRDAKIDLGVGVYRDAAGATPVMRAVKDAWDPAGILNPGVLFAADS